MGRPQNKVKYPGKLLMRLINYIFRDYKVHCIAVFILIFVGVIANVQGTMFTRDLIDKYITPFLLSDGTPNFSPLAHAIERVYIGYRCAYKRMDHILRTLLGEGIFML